MILKDIKHQDMADFLNINKSTFSNKINRINGNDFKTDEIKKCVNIMDLIWIFFLTFKPQYWDIFKNPRIQKNFLTYRK